MHRSVRLIAVAAALTLTVSMATACDFLLAAGKGAIDLKGDFAGTVKDPDGKGLSGATIKVYKNSEIGNVTKDTGGGNFVVDLDKLTQIKPTTPEVTSAADGSWKVAGLKLTEGPYVIVAVNKRGSDFRGIDRDTRKLFSVAFTSVDKLPEFNANSAVFPNPTKATTVDLTLPAEAPPAPKATDEATPAPLPTAPPPAATPAPDSANLVQQQSNLPKPQPSTATVALKNLKLADASGTAVTPTKTGDDDFKLYDLKKLEDISVSNKYLIQADATGVGSATLLISHLDKTNKATINEVTVKIDGGKIVTDGGSSNGYTFAVPRDRGKTVLQLMDRASNTISNAIALDTSNIDPLKVRPITVILTWDKGDSTDIDLHTFDVDTGNEAWFGDLSLPSDKGSLDLDNTEGYGPETFTGKKGKYGVSINYWYGTKFPTTVKVRVITATDDKTYLKTMRSIGEWWDVGEFTTTD